ncbi:MAG: DNA-binding transcriptional LysR family regulator [Oleispira sp.]|jgi:DNA-binding transcriptional LysR family regulator
MAFDSLLLDGMVIFTEVVNSGSFTQAASNSAQAEPQGTLRISCPTSFTMARLQHIFPDFITQHPIDFTCAEIS